MIVMLTVDNVKKIEPASRGDIGWPVLAGYHAFSKGSPQSAQVTLTSRVARMMVPRGSIHCCKNAD